MISELGFGIVIGIVICASVYELDRWIKRKKVPVYDEEEVHENCTVRILHNTKTDEFDIGWWHGREADLPIIRTEVKP